MCNKHYTTSVKTRFTFVFYTDSYIRGINHIFFKKVRAQAPSSMVKRALTRYLGLASQEMLQNIL